MIPGKIVRFLEEYANLACAGTRNRDLVPFGHRVSGWRVGPDGRRLTAFIAPEFTAGLIESLEENGQFALTIEEFPSHETYQFKGRYLHYRPVEPDDLEIVGRIRERFVRSVRPLFSEAPEEPFKASIPIPSLAVEFEVLEVFVQTPGPGAGARLVPPPQESEP